MADEVTIMIPQYAARFLLESMKRERKRLAEHVTLHGYGTGAEAAYDSINQIECAFPPSFGRYTLTEGEGMEDEDV